MLYICNKHIPKFSWECWRPWSYLLSASPGPGDCGCGPLRLAGQVGLGESHHCSRFLLQKARHLPAAVGWGPPCNRGDFSIVAENPSVESRQEPGHRACPLLPESGANSEEAPACGWKTAEAAGQVRQVCHSHCPARRLTPAGLGPPPGGSSWHLTHPLLTQTQKHVSRFSTRLWLGSKSDLLQLHTSSYS